MSSDAPRYEGAYVGTVDARREQRYLDQSRANKQGFFTALLASLTPPTDELDKKLKDMLDQQEIDAEFQRLKRAMPTAPTLYVPTTSAESLKMKNRRTPDNVNIKHGGIEGALLDMQYANRH